jgi:hypothetical protein
MFIAWQQRVAFEDTIKAMAWERGATDHHRIPALWVHQFASPEDPVHDQVPTQR